MVKSIIDLLYRKHYIISNKVEIMLVETRQALEK